MMDEEIRQAVSEVREMKQMCGNINMKLTNIVTQRGQDWKKKLEAEYQRGFEDGKAVHEKGCEGCMYQDRESAGTPCIYCSNNFRIQWTAKQTDDKIEVGDEVKSLSDSGVEIEGLLPWVVTTVDQGDYCQGIDSKGEVHATKKVRACKTGRHFDIEKILEAMKHD